MNNKTIPNVNTRFSGTDDSFEIEITPTQDELSGELSDLSQKISQIDKKLEPLTCEADALDYGVAAGIGAIAGVVECFLCGKYDINKANEIGTKQADRIVAKEAMKLYPDGTFHNKSEQIAALEKNARVNYDPNASDFGGGNLHHLRDYAHHPSLKGLLASIKSQLHGEATGVLENGALGTVAAKGRNKDIGGSVFKATANWAAHLISDMAGSSGSAAKGNPGMGIPGPIMSMIYESAVKKNNTVLIETIESAYQGTNGVKIDMRTEMGMTTIAVGQTMIVTIVEALARGFYFVRRLCDEIQEKNIKSVKEIKKIDWKKVSPFKGRTVKRMVMVALSTMTAIDIAESAVESLIKSGGVPATFFANFALGINYPGLLRTSFAVGGEIIDCVKESSLRNKRIALMNEYIRERGMVIEYKQKDNWKTIKDIQNELDDISILLKDMYEQTDMMIKEENALIECVDKEKLDDNNPGLSDALLDELKWG